MCRFICLFSTLNTENFQAASTYIVYLKIVSSVKVRLRRSHSGLLCIEEQIKQCVDSQAICKYFFPVVTTVKRHFFCKQHCQTYHVVSSHHIQHKTEPRQRPVITFIWKVSFVWEFPACNLIMFCDHRILRIWSVVLMVNDPPLQHEHLSISASVEGGSHFDWWEAKRVIP